MEEINIDCSKCYKLYSSCGYVGKYCQYKNNSEILKQLKRKEKECEELRKCVDALSITREKLIADLSNSIYSLGLANKNVNLYYQALQEIKEIVNNEVNLEFDITKKLKEIKNIIDEVEK